ncbi:unnamed protein product, partial [Vitis vinifera]|uniref:Uncharacterized protein n=1 Tax=Vitis vinifera TaxID=29760 RepID=D7SUJ4_VITVI
MSASTSDKPKKQRTKKQYIPPHISLYPAPNLYLHHHHQGRLCRATTFLESRMTVLEKEDWRSVIGLVTNAKQVVTPVQDVGSKVAGYAKC